MTVNNILVVGAGTMGRGIAQAFAQGGFDVHLYDEVTGIAAGAIEKLQAGLAKVVAREKMSQQDADAIIARIHIVENLALVAADAQFVIEAVVEDLAAKTALFADLNDICPPDAIFATNTSSLSVTELGHASGRPEAFIGLHFFNPAQIMKPVEIVVTADTSAETVETVEALVAAIAKTPIHVTDSTGFVVNRLLIPMINEAVRLLEEGVATAKDIDTAMKLGCGFPMGPLELSDLIGNDITLAAMRSLEATFGSAKYRPASLLEQMVAEGKLGRKSGEGFTDQH